jgi:uncharacterized protein YjdB
MKAKTLLALTAALLVGACSDGAGNDGGPIGPGETDAVARVDVSAPATAVDVGTTMQLAATPRAADGRELAGRPVAWTSDNHAVATVTTAGMVTAHAAGTATIAAISEGRRGEATLTVRPVAQDPEVLWVQITPAGDLVQPQGSTRQLGFVARGANGVEVPGRTATWSSSNPAIVSVSATGMLEARAHGSAVVTATVDGKTGSTTVLVPTRIDRVEMNRAVLALGVGVSEQLRATAHEHGGGVVEHGFTWTSSNSAVATVDATGRVTGRGFGTATITATIEGKSGSVRVDVGSWTRVSLLAVGDSALPATVLRYTETGPDGPRTLVYRATEGFLRMTGADSRFELMLNGWFGAEGGMAAPAAYGTSGTYAYDVFNGDVIFQTPGHPAFRGRVRADGRFEVKWRPEPRSAEVTLVFEGIR